MEREHDPRLRQRQVELVERLDRVRLKQADEPAQKELELLTQLSRPVRQGRAIVAGVKLLPGCKQCAFAHGAV